LSNVINYSLSAAWPRGLKRRFYDDRVIMIAWFRFNPHAYRHVVVSLDEALYEALKIISAWWLRTSNKLRGKKSKKRPENSEMGNS